MKINPKNNKGFTLIELLVVVAIIGILASVILASLSSARIKGKDASLKEEIAQLINLANLNFNDYGDYSYLKADWIPGTPSALTCATAFTTGNYATQAVSICNNILSNAGKNSSFAGNILYANTQPASGGTYSYMVLLNDGNWFCSGSSGRKGEYASYTTNPGCYDNP